MVRYSKFDKLLRYKVIILMQIQSNNDNNIQGISIFGYEFKLLVFADDVMFLVSCTIPALLKKFSSSYIFPRNALH